MRFSELDGKSIALWGAGRETTALQAQLEQRLPAAQITAIVDDDTRQPDARAALQAADVLVRSPGVSLYKPLIQEALGNGLTVTTATSLWLAERGADHVIGVTGTKGKSTTASVIAHLLNAVTHVELAGNIGRAVIDLLDTPADTWVVLELSSYQLADLAVGPQTAVITNLYKEHTDWHGSEDRYRADKLRLFSLPEVRAAVYPLGDAEIGAAVAALPRAVPCNDPAGWHVDQNGSVCHGGDVILPCEQIPLRGRHNAQNVATALAAIEAAGLDRPPLPDSIAGLTALPHRLQTVHTTPDKIEWVDDSISTTPESTIAALDAFSDRPVVLIAGGQDRAQDFELLGFQIAARVQNTVLIALPDTGPRLLSAAAARGHPEARMSTAGDMREATAQAAQLATANSVVLLSPAAPSFNRYANFEQRGDDFAAQARSLYSSE